jgi:PKHD-type hydroxylase
MTDDINHRHLSFRRLLGTPSAPDSNELVMPSPANASKLMPLRYNNLVTAPLVFHRKVSLDECKRISLLLHQLSLEPGKSLRAPDGYKKSSTAWLPDADEYAWVFDLIVALFEMINSHYKFQVNGLVDAPQYCKYGVGDHFDWHLDNSEQQTTMRKISLSIQLSDPNSYVGGNLEFCPHGLFDDARDTGTVIAFPSYLAHRVTSITEGSRESLVAWAYGSAFQ